MDESKLREIEARCVCEKAMAVHAAEDIPLLIAEVRRLKGLWVASVKRRARLRRRLQDEKARLAAADRLVKWATSRPTEGFECGGEIIIIRRCHDLFV